MKSSYRTKSRASAFTIIELLVATAVTALLMSLIVTIIASVMKGWNDSSGKLTSSGQARLALDQLATDLQGAILRSDGNVWLAVTVLPNTTNSGKWKSPTNPKPSSGSKTLYITAADNAPSSTDVGKLEYARYGEAGAWLRFFTTKAATSTDASLPAAVGYQIVRREITGGASAPSRYMLFRGIVAPSATFTAGYNLDPTTGAYISGNEVVTPILDNVILENAVDFGVRLYVKESNTLRLIFPAAAKAQNAAPTAGTLSATNTTHLSKSGTAVASDYYANSFPDVVDIMVRVLTDEGAKQLDLYENGSITGNWWDIVEANSTVYTRRIEINAKSL